MKWTEIDGLRALAVSGVMLTHWGPEWLKPFNTGGFGVRLFFTISGFLITGILLRRREAIDLGRSTIWQELKTFYARRTLRIFPAYYALIAVFVALGFLGHDMISGVPWHIAYLSNFYVFKLGHWPGYFGHFWSLAVEEQFYLIWPALVFLVPAKLFRPLLVTLMFSAVAFRSILFVLGFDPEAQVAVLLPACLDPLCFGALLAAMVQRGDNLPTRTLVLIGIAGALACAAVAVGRTLGYVGGTVINNFAIGMVSFAALGGIVSRRHSKAFGWLNAPPLQFLGQRSYGAYLYHPLGAVVVDALSHGALGTWPRVIAAFSVTLAISQASWVLLERPLLRLKDRFEYGQAERRLGAAEPA